MPIEPGDYIKAEFKDAASGESEWMWVKVSSADEANRLVFGTLDNEPLIMARLRFGASDHCLTELSPVTNALYRRTAEMKSL